MRKINTNVRDFARDTWSFYAKTYLSDFPVRLLNDLCFFITLSSLRESESGFCASSNNHAICPRTLSTLPSVLSVPYTTTTGFDSLNDGFPSLSSEHSIKYHFSASVMIPKVFPVKTSPSSISLALRLRFDKAEQHSEQCPYKNLRPLPLSRQQFLRIGVNLLRNQLVRVH